jgi:hypothetical protein
MLQAGIQVGLLSHFLPSLVRPLTSSPKQCGVEVSLLGISYINHAHIRKYIAPRKRYIEAVFRFFGLQSA